MHEYALTQSILQMAEEYAGRQDAKRVTAIHLVVGEDCGAVADSLALYFDILAEGTLCEGAVLRVKRVRPKLRCVRCGQLFIRKPFSFACPAEGCGGEGEPTEIGREFMMRAIEVE